MSEQEEKEITQETVTAETSENPSETTEQAPAPKASLPVLQPSGPVFGAITVLYIVFVLALACGLIALSVFLFFRLWNWISG